MKQKKWPYIIVGVTVITLVLTGILVLFNRNDQVSAVSMVSSATDSLSNLQTIHLTKKSQSYSNGQLDRGTVEEVWIEMPNKLHSISSFSGPDGSVYKSEMVYDGNSLAVFSFNEKGEYVSAQVIKNSSPFPGDSYSANPIYEGYIRQLNLLLNTDKYRLISEESVGGRPALKIQLTNDIDMPVAGTVGYWYLDKSDFVLLKEEIYKDGLLTFNSEVDSYEINNAISEEEFKVIIPSNLAASNGTLEVTDLAYKTYSVENAKMISGYQSSIPSYLPEGFELSEAGVINTGQVVLNDVKQDSAQIWKYPTYLTYRNGNQYIYVCEDYIWSPDQEDPFNIIGIDYLRAEEIPLSKGNAYLFARGEKNGTLVFFAGNLKVKITGALTHDDLIKVAESIIAQNP